jgi:hypothetical protein
MNRWISVKDSLPNENGLYLCFCKGYGNHHYYDVVTFANCLEKVDKYDFEGRNRCGWYNYDSEYGYYEQDVTHWMPLPEPPKMKGGAE